MGGSGGRFAVDEHWLPIKFGPVSNGEFHPVPHSPFLREVIRRTHRLADDNARRLGISRREFLTGVTGAAATLFVLGACSEEESAGRSEPPGGTFDVSEDATTDTSAALADLGGEEFIFDVQTHYVNYDLAALEGDWTAMFPQSGCAQGETGGDTRACFTADAYFREVFVRSDTSMAILSALPTPDLQLARGHGARHRCRHSDRMRRPRAHARWRLPAPGAHRGRTHGHERSAGALRHRGVEDLHDDPQ
jgi:hypothetical protein